MSERAANFYQNRNKLLKTIKMTELGVFCQAEIATSKYPVGSLFRGLTTTIGREKDLETSCGKNLVSILEIRAVVSLRIR